MALQLAVAAPLPAPRLRLTRRGRLVVGVAACLPLLAAVMMGGALRADAGSALDERGPATSVVVVQAGESLWQIAKAVAPDADPRETLTVIRDLNGLGDRAVVAGESIVVPLR